MHRYGLIGYPLTHSFSPAYFAEKFAREGIADARYDAFPLPDLNDFPALLAQYPDLCGLNVTIPYKEAIIPFLDELDPEAAAVGAVNTIVVRSPKSEVQSPKTKDQSPKSTHPKLIGYNTDVTGFERSLTRWMPATPGHAFVLGTGGAAKAVCHVLERLGIPYRLVSRRDEEATLPYEALPALDFDAMGTVLWVNTTPLGTYPEVNTCPPLPFEQLNDKHLIYDLVYNPPETLLLQRAAARGAAVKNGREMLEIQAEEAWKIWRRTVDGGR